MMNHRIRVAGLLRQGDKILLVEQLNPRSGQKRWVVPGGGLEVDDPDIFRGVEREVFEETGLRVRAGAVRFVSEYVNTYTQILQIGLWIDCEPEIGYEFETPHTENTREDDYISAAAWFTKEEILTTLHEESILRYESFWEGMAAGDGRVTWLGRKTEHI